MTERPFGGGAAGGGRRRAGGGSERAGQRRRGRNRRWWCARPWGTAAGCGRFRVPRRPVRPCRVNHRSVSRCRRASRTIHRPSELKQIRPTSSQRSRTRRNAMTAALRLRGIGRSRAGPAGRAARCGASAGGRGVEGVAAQHLLVTARITSGAGRHAQVDGQGHPDRRGAPGVPVTCPHCARPKIFVDRLHPDAIAGSRSTARCSPRAAAPPPRSMSAVVIRWAMPNSGYIRSGSASMLPRVVVVLGAFREPPLHVLFCPPPAPAADAPSPR